MGQKHRIILLFFTFLMIISSAFAWDQMDNSPYPDRSLPDFGYYADASNISKDTKIRNSTNQILVSDLDNDGNSEVIVTEDDALYIYNITSDFELDLQASYFITGATGSITPAVFPDSDSDGLNELVGIWGNFFYYFTYNGSKEFNKISLVSKHDMGRAPATQMVCDLDHDYSMTDKCWIGTEDGYVQEILLTAPFVIFPWDMQDEPESDGDGNDGLLAIGDYLSNYGISFSQVIRGHESGNIDELRVIINSTNGDPENTSFIYNIKICQFDNNVLNGTVFDNCQNTPTLLSQNVNITSIFGDTPGIKSIPLDDYFLEASYNYSLIFEYISGATINGNSDNWEFEVDTAPTTDLIMRSLVGGANTTLIDSSVITGTLFGSAVSEVFDETDICPGNNACLDGAPDESGPLMIQDGNDGTWKLVFIHDNNANGENGLALVDIDNLDLDTQFNLIGYDDAIGGASDNQIKGIAIGDIDGGGDDIIVHQSMYALFLYDGTYLNAFDLSGDEVADDWILTGGSCGGASGNEKGSFPVKLEYEITPGYFADTVWCGISSCINGAQSDSTIGCYDLTDGTTVIDYDSPTGSTWDSEIMGRQATPVYSARMMYNVDNQPQLIAQRGIMIFNYSDQDLDYFITIAPMTNGGDPNNVHTITVADANDDGSLDILGIRTGGISGPELFFSTADFSNEPPVINNSLAYGGFGGVYGVDNPSICLGTSVEFFAKESGVWPSGNYENDLSLDEERLVTNCGYDENGSQTIDNLEALQEGSYDTDNPSIDCFYNETGAYRFRIYVQDEANEDDYSAGNIQDIFVTVINGTPNEDCNIISDYVDTGEITIGVNGTAVGSPCFTDDQCLTDNCEYGVCTYKAGSQECNHDFECLSQECENGRCLKAPLWDQIEAVKDSQYGDDPDTNNFLALVISIAIAGVFIVGSGGRVAGIIAGLVLCFGSLAFFTIVGWLSGWIFFGIVFVLILLAVLVALIFRGAE